MLVPVKILQFQDMLNESVRFRDIANGLNYDDEGNSATDGNVETCSKRTKLRIIRSCWFNKDFEPEKYYRQLLMLFTSWRNEETDLIGSCCSYQEHYKQICNAIK